MLVWVHVSPLLLKKSLSLGWVCNCTWLSKKRKSLTLHWKDYIFKPSMNGWHCKEGCWPLRLHIRSCFVLYITKGPTCMTRVKVYIESESLSVEWNPVSLSPPLALDVLCLTEVSPQHSPHTLAFVRSLSAKTTSCNVPQRERERERERETLWEW